MVRGGKPTLSTATVQRPQRLAAAAVVIAALGTMTGCGVTTAHRASDVPSALASGNQQAPAVCAQKDPGSDFSIAVFAKGAASGLKRARVTPNPWARLSPNTIVFACFVARANRLTDGRYVDTSGDSSPIPVGTYNDCPPPNPAATGTAVSAPPAICSSRLGGSPSRSINPAILAVLGVIAITAIWYVTRRRKRQASL
jgi:hypothetical protein